MRWFLKKILSAGRDSYTGVAACSDGRTTRFSAHDDGTVSATDAEFIEFVKARAGTADPGVAVDAWLMEQATGKHAAEIVREHGLSCQLC